MCIYQEKYNQSNEFTFANQWIIDKCNLFFWKIYVNVHNWILNTL